MIPCLTRHRASGPNYVGSGNASAHSAAGLILDLYAAKADLGSSPGSNSDSTNRGTWTDLSGNNLNFGLSNFAYTTSSGWTGSNTSGDPDRLEFDGVDDNANKAYTATLDLATLTVDMWFYPRAFTTSGRIMTTSSSWTNMWGIIFLDTLGNIRLGTGSNVVGQCLETSTPPLTANQLTHLRAQFSTSVTDLKVWINNSPVTLISAGAGVSQAAGSMRISAKADASNYGKNGVISTRIYNRLLSDSEGTQNYNAGVTW